MKNQLHIGERAPDFSARDVFGYERHLRDYKDNFVLLVFLRYSGCPWCNLAVHRLSMEYSLLKKSGCEVVAFMQSKKTNIVENIYDRHAVRPDFPVIADQGRRIYDRYHVSDSIAAAGRSLLKIPYWLQAIKTHGFKQSKIDGNLLLVPAMFLVGPGDQEIVKAEYGQSFYDHETFTGVYQRLVFNEV